MNEANERRRKRAAEGQINTLYCGVAAVVVVGVFLLIAAAASSGNGTTLAFSGHRGHGHGHRRDDDDDDDEESSDPGLKSCDFACVQDADPCTRRECFVTEFGEECLLVYLNSPECVPTSSPTASPTPQPTPQPTPAVCILAVCNVEFSASCVGEPQCPSGFVSVPGADVACNPGCTCCADENNVPTSAPTPLIF